MIDIKKYRENARLWGEFSFKQVTVNGWDCDANAEDRYAMLIALQYNWRREDEEFVRYLFEQEIIASENCCDTGALTQAAYLMVRYRTPSDIILFYRAKHSNFDASCGFDREFMFWALRDATYEYIMVNHPDIYIEFKAEHAHIAIVDGLDAWWRSLARQYPEQIEDENLYTLYDRSIRFGDKDGARAYLEQWSAATPETPEKVYTLKYAYKDLGDYEKAIELARILLKENEKPWDRASCLCDLIALNHLAQNFSDGLTVVRQLNTVFSQFDDWKNVGLGRMAIHEAFALSLASDDLDTAREIFRIARSWAGKCHGIAFVGLTAAWKAAEKCGYNIQAKRYKKMANKERRRIDKLSSC